MLELCRLCQAMRSKACAKANSDFAGISSTLKAEVYVDPVILIYQSTDAKRAAIRKCDAS